MRGCNHDSQPNIINAPPPVEQRQTSNDKNVDAEKKCPCYLPSSDEFKSQSGQDEYGLCCQGVFVEFGARDGITHSNTYVYEKNFGWKGLLFEVDAVEHQMLVQNDRPNSNVVLGPVCPSTMDNVTIFLSTIPGFTGTSDTYEPHRYQSDGCSRNTNLSMSSLGDGIESTT